MCERFSKKKHYFLLHKYSYRFYIITFSCWKKLNCLNSESVPKLSVNKSDKSTCQAENVIIKQTIRPTRQNLANIILHSDWSVRPCCLLGKQFILLLLRTAPWWGRGAWEVKGIDLYTVQQILARKFNINRETIYLTLLVLFAKIAKRKNNGVLSGIFVLY